MKLAIRRALWTAPMAALFAAPGMFAAGTPAQRNGQSVALVVHALDNSDIQSPDAPAFRLRAQVQVDFGQGRIASGQMFFVWAPGGWWHNEVALGDYHRLEVSTGKQEWLLSNLRYLPFPIFVMQRALALPLLLRAALGQPLSAPVSGSGDVCVRTTGRGDQSEYCFDPNSGNLVRVTDSRWNATYEYSDYEALAEREFPRDIRVLRGNGETSATIHVDEMTTEQRFNLRDFLPGKGAIERPVAGECTEIIPVKLKKMVRPKYPQQAQAVGISGVVRFYAEVGTDGKPRGMWLLNSSPPVLTEAAEAAVKEWRYHPEICQPGGKKLPAIVPINVLFVTQ
jgi:TonB family protein